MREQAFHHERSETTRMVSNRAQELLGQHRDQVARQTDRLFACLLLLQWAAAITVSLWFTPTTWIGSQGQIHAHLLAAIFLGGLIASFPLMCIRLQPGSTMTRHVVAVGQMLLGALLIHLTGGRIETHFHVFGSLALLAFYRDWRVLVTATVVVGLDHMLRGIWWPQSVFGIAEVSDWRWLEHTAWVIFIDVFLIGACVRNLREMKIIARRQAESEHTNAVIEARVQERTAELEVAKREAEQATRFKSEFLANMSHEIRTPMTAIRGFTELLAEAGPELEPETRAEYLHTIRRNSDHLLAIINDILDLSKIEAKRMSVELIETAPEQILFDVASLMQVKARERGVRYQVVRATPLPAVIHSDPVRLRQILVNLVGNAIKFTEKGEVTVLVSLDRADRDRPVIRFEVKDTGIGMTPDQAGRIFRAFTQADASTTRKFGGTGLGLRISQGLATLLGGDIQFSSVFGEGSRFTLTLPTGPIDGVKLIAPADAGKVLTENDPKVSAPTPELGPLLEGTRVYFVEDGLDNQRLIRFHLERAGAVVTVFENGRDCLCALTEDGTVDGSLRTEPPCDLVLTDMQMPEMDGYTLARQLRRAGWSGPIIALTAHAMDGVQQRCLDAGCNDYASKPIDRLQLLRTCAQWASGHAA